MKPLIGITTMYDYTGNRNTIGDDYITSIVKAGGIPVAIPVNIPHADLPLLIQKLDGLLLSGGEDVNPLIFGEQPQWGLGEIDIYRDELEIELTKIAIEQKKPILGICRGLQVLNIVCGGGIIQDIPSQHKQSIQHRQKGPRFLLSHTVDMVEETLLHKIIGKTTMAVNSFHHQGISKLAPNLVANCHSTDGIIEGIEDKEGNILAVQWHPENLCKTTQENIKLFQWLVEKSTSM